jgi:hypothetical protein
MPVCAVRNYMPLLHNTAATTPITNAFHTLDGCKAHKTGTNALGPAGRACPNWQLACAQTEVQSIVNHVRWQAHGALCTRAEHGSLSGAQRW